MYHILKTQLPPSMLSPMIRHETFTIEEPIQPTRQILKNCFKIRKSVVFHMQLMAGFVLLVLASLLMSLILTHLVSPITHRPHTGNLGAAAPYPVINCIVYNWQDMSCEWSTRKIDFSLRWTVFEGTGLSYPCPEPYHGDGIRGCLFLPNPGNTSMIEQTRNAFRADFTYTFYVKNPYRTDYGMQRVNTKYIVKPARPPGLNVSIGYTMKQTMFVVTWNRVPEAQHRHLLYLVTWCYIKPRVTNASINNLKECSRAYTKVRARVVPGAYNHGMYTVYVRCIPEFLSENLTFPRRIYAARGFWSIPSTYTFVTNSRLISQNDPLTPEQVYDINIRTTSIRTTELATTAITTMNYSQYMEIQEDAIHRTNQRIAKIKENLQKIRQKMDQDSDDIEKVRFKLNETMLQLNLSDLMERMYVRLLHEAPPKDLFSKIQNEPNQQLFNNTPEVPIVFDKPARLSNASTTYMINTTHEKPQNNCCSCCFTALLSWLCPCLYVIIWGQE